MEFSKVEMKEVAKAADEAVQAITELADLDLVTVGGGCGEVVFY